MSNALARLALLQFIAVILSVLLAGTLLKVRFGSGSHFPILATNVRDYGIFLLLVPTVWGTWGALRVHRPRAGSGDAGTVFLTGIILFGLLVCVGLFSFTSVVLYRSVILAAPQGQTAPVAPIPEQR